MWISHLHIQIFSLERQHLAPLDGSNNSVLRLFVFLSNRNTAAFMAF